MQLIILAQIKRELGNLDKVTRIVKLIRVCKFGCQNFTQHPKVINPASDLLFEIFGEKGKHARVAVGVACLPLDSMTEIDAIVEFSK